ncbi:X-ray repair cross-complementing protein 6 [Ischnura elegans]|uniref:X-ray repair cross-complementing protein 6 n=1 Tax=Ischnura elegans TaxID=197161 RepID=UPI001ED8AC33|nr:X-ray repair cross-complementing protein 6 [Ischnura elegans]
MNDSSDTEEEVSFKAGRDGIIILIDATEPMFAEDASGSCAFKECIIACDQAMMHKIKFSPSDLMAVVFFGTEKTCNDGNRSHVSVLNGLQRPCIESLNKLRTMHQSFSSDLFKENYGHSNDYLFGDVLWLAQSMLTKCITKLASSRIILLSCCEMFGKDDNYSQRHANVRANDLKGNAISMEFIPCVPGYIPSDFISTIMQIVGDSNDPWTVPRSLAIDQLEDIPNIVVSVVGSQDQRSRVIAHLDFRIGDNVSVPVEVYNLIREEGGPKKEKLYKVTNERITSKVVHQVQGVQPAVFDEEAGDVSFSESPVIGTPAMAAMGVEEEPKTVQKVDLDKTVDAGEETARLSMVEYDALQKFIDTGLVLLGFVPLDLLRITHHHSPASFVYPSRSSTSGSRDLFAALWHRMGVKEVAAICSYTARKGMRPRFGALVPSGLEKDKEVYEYYRKHHINAMPDPQGFHIFMFPYNDNISHLGLPGRPSASSDQVAAAVLVLKKLRSPFHPSQIPNPANETRWAAIEALALELDRDSIRPVIDEIMPDYEVIDERLGGLAKAFTRSVYPADYDPSAPVKKARAPTKRALVKTEMDELDLDLVEAAMKNRKVHTLKMDLLKAYMRSKGLPVAGKKKQELVDEIYGFKYL